MHAVRAPDDAMLTDVCDAIRSALSVRAIYLFGSRARGDARPDSDHDILVVTLDGRPDQHARGTVSQALTTYLPSVDVHFVTAPEFEWRRRFSNTIERAADREGVALFMASEVEDRYAVARPWFDGGARGLRLGSLALREGDMPDEACFHAQQATEQYLKGYLTLIDKEGRRTHNLETLAHLCADGDSTFAPWATRLAPLSQYAVVTRYPNGRNTDDTEARQAMSIAVEFQTFVRERIALYRGETE